MLRSEPLSSTGQTDVSTVGFRARGTTRLDGGRGMQQSQAVAYKHSDDGRAAPGQKLHAKPPLGLRKRVFL